jgi:hypothetical protein
MKRSFIPSDSNRKSTFRPVSSLNDGHLPSHVAPWTIKNLVGVAVIGCREVVAVTMAGMEMHAVVRVHSRHDGRLGIQTRIVWRRRDSVQCSTLKLYLTYRRKKRKETSSADDQCNP